MKNVEELSFIVNLARDSGKIEQQNSQLAAENESLRLRVEELQRQAESQQAVVESQQAVVESQQARIRQLEALVTVAQPDAAVAAQTGAQQVVVVNQYFMLSGEKTSAYVSSLDDAHRMFAGHMLIHTLADGTPRCLLDKVTEMTRLDGGKRQDRLAGAIELAASKPTEVVVSGDYVAEKQVENEVANVENMTSIPSVGNYQPQIKTQNIEAPTLPSEQQQEPKRLEDE